MLGKDFYTPVEIYDCGSYSINLKNKMWPSKNIKKNGESLISAFVDTLKQNGSNILIIGCAYNKTKSYLAASCKFLTSKCKKSINLRI